MSRLDASSFITRVVRHPATPPLLLALTLWAAYLPSLSGGFLNYDDPWLIEQNSFYADSSPAALVSIWTDWSKPTRLNLGAEYLPVRDTSHWLEFRLFGASAEGMRWLQLALYVAGVLMLRAALRLSLENRWWAEGCAWLFAVHPVHVESVAWLAGRKDVLALCFFGAAAWVHMSQSKHRAWAAAMLFGMACLSKSMAVASIGILLGLELSRGSMPALKRYLPLLGVAATVLLVHISVGQQVGMLAEPAGGSRLSAAATMGPVWLEYLRMSLWPPALSISHDVAIRTQFDWLSVGGWGFLILGGLGSFWLWRQRRPLWLSCWLCFFVPLSPVSQVLFPLQNLMADRYMLFSILGVCLLLAACLAHRWLGRAGPIALGLCIVALAGFTAQRASLYADSVALFRDATRKTRHNPIAPYQLARALEAKGKRKTSLKYYLKAIERGPLGSEISRRATNDAARLLVARGRFEQASKLLSDGHAQWPSDPMLLYNLAQVSAERGDFQRACRELAFLKRRFADYPVRVRWQARCSLK